MAVVIASLAIEHGGFETHHLYQLCFSSEKAEVASERRKREGGVRGARGSDCFEKEESSNTPVRPGWGVNHLRWEDRC